MSPSQIRTLKIKEPDSVPGIRIDLSARSLVDVRRGREGQGSNTPEPFITSLHGENQRQNLFHDDKDRECCLDRLCWIRAKSMRE